MAIAARAAECSRLFDEWLKSSAFITPDVENQIFRFNLWVTNNFIFAPTRASMDWRLRSAPLLESAMVDLLDDLKSNFIKQSAISKNATEQEGGNLALPDAISETLDSLFRLSRAIRRSGILRRFVKITGYTDYDENGVNLTEEFRKGAERIIEFRLKPSKASQDLQKRIIDTICLRQQHFSYLRARKAKNMPINKNIGKPQSVPKSTLGATFSITGSLSQSSTGKKPPNKLPRGPGFSPSILTATTVQPDRMTKAHSIKSREDTRDHNVICNDADLPPPPKGPDHVKEFECPYCFLVCSAEELSGERWKHHIVQDLMPYVCVLESCHAPNVLFESSKDWLGHMRNQHVVSGWVCMDNSHGSPISFSTDWHFRHHMYQYHLGQFDDTDLNDLAAACHQGLPDDNIITECPFCPADQNTDIEPGEMMNHMVGHLLSLAQISLTGHMDGDDGQSECSESKLDYRLPKTGSLGSLPGRLYSEFPDEIEDEEDNIQEYNSHLSPGEVIPNTDEEECSVQWQNVRKPPEDPPLDPTLRSFIARFEMQAKEIGIKVPTVSDNSSLHDFQNSVDRDEKNDLNAKTDDNKENTLPNNRPEFLDSESLTSGIMTSLAEAARSGDVDALSLLLEKAAGGIRILDFVTIAAVGNEKSGKEITKLLFDRRGDQITITEEVVIAAAKNQRNGKGVMTLLLDHRGGEIPITEGVVITAAKNERNGKEVMALLLDRRSDEIPITEKMVIAAAGNYWNGEEVMALLLDRRGDEIPITEKVVISAAENYWNGKEVMALLLDRRGVKIPITEGVAMAVAGNGQNGKEVMALLLDRRGDDIPITEKVVMTAAGNEANGKEVMAVLLDCQGDEIPITEKVVIAAAGNNGWSGKEVMALLLDRRSDDIPITKEVVIAAAGNGANGKDVMALLLDRRGDKIPITENVVIAAAGNNGWSGKEVMTLLLDRQGDDIPITEKVAIAAAGNNGWSGKEIMASLLDRRGDEVPITEEVVIAAAGNEWNGKEVMVSLLDRRGDGIPITEKVITAAAKNSRTGKAIMALLPGRRGNQKFPQM